VRIKKRLDNNPLNFRNAAIPSISKLLENMRYGFLLGGREFFPILSACP
jgi:hypothetical protein